MKMQKKTKTKLKTHKTTISFSGGGYFYCLQAWLPPASLRGVQRLVGQSSRGCKAALLQHLSSINPSPAPTPSWCCHRRSFAAWNDPVLISICREFPFIAPGEQIGFFSGRVESEPALWAGDTGLFVCSWGFQNPGRWLSVFRHL